MPIMETALQVEHREVTHKSCGPSSLDKARALQVEGQRNDGMRIDALSQRSRAHVFWHGRSVRSQLVIIVLLINFCAALVGGAVVILMARSATRIEIAASTELARHLVNEAVRRVPEETTPHDILAGLPLQLRSLRHVRISVQDAADRPVSYPATRDGSGLLPGNGRPRAPGWFRALVAAPTESMAVPVIAKGERIGSVLIAGEPDDEIAEVWENTVALALVGLLVSVAAVITLSILFGRALAPLKGLDRGLRDLEGRNYNVRLPRPEALEFAALTDRFNALAEALSTARAENATLNQRLITAQDDERRRTALDLHDEVGPGLFGLKVNAASIAALVGQPIDTTAGKIAERARDMLAVIEQLQAINRSILVRLRPMALGYVPLQELIAEMVRQRARQHPEVSFSFSPGQLRNSYGDSIDLTVYRCVQESLTNAVRHANAKTIATELGEVGEDAEASNSGATSRRIVLSIQDDGCGISPNPPMGFGLSGMQERVHALGGEFSIEGVPQRGTSVRVVIPVEVQAARVE
jgi:two-component system sensor histidine kinase UhpB